MIVPPKSKSVVVQCNFRWPSDLPEEIRAIAERSGRSLNETGELLMRWAVERAKAEYEAVAETENPLGVKRKK